MGTFLRCVSLQGTYSICAFFLGSCWNLQILVQCTGGTSAVIFIVHSQYSTRTTVYIFELKKYSLLLYQPYEKEYALLCTALLYSQHYVALAAEQAHDVPDVLY